MRSPHLKTRIVVPVVLGLLGVAAAVAAGVGWMEHRSLHADLARTLKGADATLKAQLDADADAMAAALPFVCDDRKMVEAFLSRSKLRLQAAGDPLADRLRNARVAAELTLLDANLNPVYTSSDTSATDGATHRTAAVARKTAKPATVV
jgi:hypothetical protein